VAKQFTEEELKKKLTPEQYRILREKGTELPFTGKYLNHNENGMYTCAVCGAELFDSKTKYESKMAGLEGWPSFADVASSKAVKLTEDKSHGVHRVEVACANCGSHLGHVFSGDNDSPTGMHFCINSACLDFEPKDKADKSADSS
jgi:peptide-methionine (R)-S-oxide reductase